MSYTCDWLTKEGQMARRTFNPEKVINLLREAEVLLSQGLFS